MAKKAYLKERVRYTQLLTFFYVDPYIYIYMYISVRGADEKQQLPSNSWYGKRQLSFSTKPKHAYCMKTIDFKEI